MNTLPSLRGRLLILIMLIIVFLSGLLVYNLMETRKKDARNTQQDAMALARLVSYEQEEYFTEARQLLYLIAQMKGREIYQGGHRCNLLLKEINNNYPHFANIGFIDPEGNARCSALPFKEGTWLGDRTYFRKAMETGEFSVGNFQVGRITGMSSINFGYPVRDQDAVVRGVLYIALDLVILGDKLRKLAFPEGAIITLVDEKGVILARYPDVENMTGKRAGDWPLLQIILAQNREGTAEALDLAGVDRLYAFTPLLPELGRGLYVSVGIPAQVAYREANALFLHKLYLLLIFAIIVSLAAWLWSERLVLGPLHALRQACQRMNSGNLGARTGLKPNTAEIAQLVKTFDTMAESLETRHREILRQDTMLIRLNRALKTLSGGNHALLRAEDEQALLEEMCQVATEAGGYRAAWIGYAEGNDGNGIRLMASSGMDEASLHYLPRSRADTGGGYSAVGAALATGEAAVISRIHWERDRKGIDQTYLAALNIRAAISLPLIVDGRVLGALTILRDDAETFDRQEREILTEMSEDLAFGIQTLRLRISHSAAENAIHRMAYFDALTGLPNLQQFESKLEAFIGKEPGGVPRAALLMLGLDRFREINNTLGFDAGNSVLRETGNRLKKVVGGATILARMDGDEFALFMPGADSGAARQQVRQILDALEPLYVIGDFTLAVNASIGVVLLPDHGNSPKNLIRRADLALQYAKKANDNVSVYRPETDQDKKNTLALAGKLHRALENNQLTLYYQPKISMASGRVIGFEALARWFHPEDGMIPPDVFIPIAENTGMIRRLTQWVLETVCQQLAHWRHTGVELPVAFNLSARNLHDPRLLNTLNSLANAWGLKADMLEIEITESAIMEDPEAAVAILSRIRGTLGVQLYIDDFGTGYSSLVALKKQPVSALKIDKSFVIDMLENKDSAVIVQSTITLAHQLGLTVVAEGVENEGVWQALQALGCDFGQGYHMGRPMPADQVTVWLRESPFGQS